MFTFPADLRILSDSKKALSGLAALLREKQSDTEKERAANRVEAFGTRSRESKESRLEANLAMANQKPITPEWLTYCIGQAIDEDTVVLDETVTNAGVVAGQPGAHPAGVDVHQRRL